ncbi:MAG: Rrf2 family transcriptional regulator [Pyrinomonadaceae bacterium]|nr:Rrf2 family transcriptional regulator [Pyrinomonadaceae bacterium]
MALNGQFAMAVHILALLAKSGDMNVKSDCIAGSVNTNPVVVRRLLSQLNNAGFVSSQTGATGGTRLARRPEDIDLSDVYRAISCGEVIGLPHRAPNPECPVGVKMETVLCELQKAVETAVADKLRRFTLRDIIAMVEGSEAPPIANIYN